MTTFYNCETLGFYRTDVHGEGIPAGSVEISHETHLALLQGQRDGKIIAPDENGHPILIDRPTKLSDET